MYNQSDPNTYNNLIYFLLRFQNIHASFNTFWAKEIYTIYYCYVKCKSSNRDRFDIFREFFFGVNSLLQKMDWHLQNC